MAKKRAEPRRMSTPTPFEQARDELFSHILRCGVLEATAEHQKEWFDDTMLYLADLGTAQNVHPHPFRAGPRRAVLPYPPMRRPGSDRRAPERVVRRHHALSRRSRNRAECPPPPLSSRPATSCSPISSDAASWKRPPSTRKSGSTTPCSISPISEPRRMSTPTPFEQARDELFSHILRCGVLEATAEHQKEWFDDTMLYLADLGTAQNVHPHPFRAGPRRAVLPYPPMRRPGSDRRAPERVVRRHHALSR